MSKHDSFEVRQAGLASRRHTSLTRSIWLKTTVLSTFLVPDGVIGWLGKKDKESKQAWREKTTLCIIMLLSSSLLLFMLEGLPQLLCAPHLLKGYTPSTLSSTNFVSIHGQVYDLSSSSNAEMSGLANSFRGMDLTHSFPRWEVLARYPGSDQYVVSEVGKCVDDTARADGWLESKLRKEGYSVTNYTINKCPGPNNTKGSSTTSCFTKKDDLMELRSNSLMKGDLQFDNSDITPANSSNHLMAIGGKVYDWSGLFSPSLDDASSPISPNRSQTLFSKSVTDELIQLKGKSVSLSKLSHLNGVADVMKCLDILFYKGKMRETSVGGLFTYCLGWSIPIIVLGLILLITLVKSLSGFVGANGGSGTHQNHCILLVPIYSETKTEIAKAISSIVSTSYIDHGKLLVLILDGVEMSETVLDLVGYQGGTAQPKDYQSLGLDKKGINKAQVYSGFHYSGSHGVPYLVVVKCGNDTEIDMQGNRGKRDSMMMVLNFLDGLSSQENLLTPLEAEMLRHLHQLDVDIKAFQYMMVMDADVTVQSDSLSIMASYLDVNPSIMAVCGQVWLSNANSDWFVHAVQTFRHLTSTHLNLQALSNLGCLTYLSGQFALYRLYQPTGTPCLAHESFLASVANQRVNTLHSRHSVLLGEEFHLSAILLKFWPTMKLAYLPSAIASTSGHKSLSQLLIRNRTNLLVQFHTALDLMFTNVMHNSSFFTTIFMGYQLVSHLTIPSITLYFYFFLIRSFMLLTFPSLIIPILLGLVLLVDLAHVCISNQSSAILGYFIHIFIGPLIFQVFLPIYSFLTMDNFFCFDLGGDQIRTRPHGILDFPSRTNRARYTLDPFEKNTYQNTRISPSLPTPTSFQSLYTEMKREGIPLNHPSENNSMRSQGNANAQDGQRNSYFNTQTMMDTHLNYPMTELSLNDAEPKTFTQLAYEERGSVDSLDQGSVSSSYKRDSGLLDLPRSSMPASNMDPSFNNNSIGLMNIGDDPEDRRSIVESVRSERFKTSSWQVQSRQANSNAPLGLAKGFPLPPSESSGSADSNLAPPNLNLNMVPGSRLSGASFSGSLNRVAPAYPPFAPRSSRMMSTMRSDYSSEYSLSVASLNPYDTYLEDNQSNYTQSHHNPTMSVTNPTTQNPIQSSTTTESISQTQLQQSRQMIQEEIYYFLHDADLHTVTRREVKQHLVAVFGDNVSYYMDFVQGCIEAFTLERLAQTEGLDTTDTNMSVEDIEAHRRSQLL